MHWCDGSKREYQELVKTLVDCGSAQWLDPREAAELRFSCALIRPTSRASRTAPFICSNKQDDAGPTNNWSDPAQMKARMSTLFEGAMVGRTMYVVPYSMGPIGSPIARIGIMVTDSVYAVVSMHIMTRVGDAVLAALGPDGEFVRGLHSVGYPLP